MTVFPERVWEQLDDDSLVSRPVSAKDIERRRLVYEMLVTADPKRRKEIADHFRQQVMEAA